MAGVSGVMANEPERSLSVRENGESLHDALAFLEIRDRRIEITVVQFLRDLISEADKRYEQRFIAQQEAIQAALLAQKEAVNAALVAADRAVGKSETASEKRFENVNEFRAQLADQAANLMPRSEAETRLGSLSDKLTDSTTLARDTADRIRTEHQRDITNLRNEFQQGLTGVLTQQSLVIGQQSGADKAQTNTHLSNTLVVAIFGAIIAFAGVVVVIIEIFRAH